MVKASEYKNVCKAVNDRKLAELKKEIIEILKKQDVKEFKKAIDYLNSQEEHFTHLEKSFSGKWIEKAGYGIGTVRVWKGKKYKKIAPDKWVRVFDKEGRGTNIAIGKLIAKVNKIDNVEDLMAFVMANKQRFVDENGMDLPVLDKFRAAVDARNGNVGSKETSKPAEKVGEGVKPARKELEKLNKKIGLSDDARIALLNLHDRNKEDAQSILSKYIRNTEDETQKRAYEEAYNYLSVNDMPKFKDGKIVESDKPAEETRNSQKEETKEFTTKKHKNIPAFEPVKSVNVKKDKIAETTKIEEGKVAIPATREIKNEIKNLIDIASKNPMDKRDSRREFLTHVYYDGENLVSTDGKQMKVIKIGEIDGIEKNKYIKIDTTGKDNIVIEQDEKDYGFYPNYKRVIPENNKQQIKLDNNALKDKINEMKKDGSIDMELKQISLKLKDGGLFLDDVRVGDAKDVNFDNGLDYISFDYRLLTNALSGDESIMSVSGDPYKSVSISTKVSDNVFMPLRTSEVNYESNKEVNAARNEAQEKQKAQNEAEKEDRKKRSMTDETKSEILKDKPEGVTDSDYEDLIDYTNNFYVNLGYDNSTPRAKAEIKRTIDNAINQINNKDYAIFDMIQNSDNKVSRKIFETITALKLGSNRESAKKAWESWVGKEGVENHKKQLEAEQKQREENAKNEKLNFINSKMDQVSKYGGNISDDRKDVVRDYLLNLKVKKDEPTYRALFSQYKYKPNDDSEYVTNNGVNFVFDKLKGNGIEYFEKYYTSIRDKPMLNFARYVNATMNGDKIKKALFDTFLLDNFLMEDIDDMEEDEEERSLWNDYSAEQPELFNSTEFKVREAMNRHFCNCL